MKVKFSVNSSDVVYTEKDSILVVSTVTPLEICVDF